MFLCTFVQLISTNINGAVSFLKQLCLLQILETGGALMVAAVHAESEFMFQPRDLWIALDG